MHYGFFSRKSDTLVERSDLHTKCHRSFVLVSQRFTKIGLVKACFARQ